MEFAFTEEQQMIRETAAQFLADTCDSAAVRRAMATAPGYEAATPNQPSAGSTPPS